MPWYRRMPKERVERAARMYASNQDAGAALGIKPGSFTRLCNYYGIETPHARRRRQSDERTKRINNGPTPEKAGELLSVAEVVTLLNVPSSWLLEHVRQGTIPVHQAHGRLRFSMDELAAWAAQQGIKGETTADEMS